MDSDWVAIQGVGLLFLQCKNCCTCKIASSWNWGECYFIFFSSQNFKRCNQLTSTKASQFVPNCSIPWDLEYHAALLHSSKGLVAF